MGRQWHAAMSLLKDTSPLRLHLIVAFNTALASLSMHSSRRQSICRLFQARRQFKPSIVSFNTATHALSTFQIEKSLEMFRLGHLGLRLSTLSYNTIISACRDAQ
ncbi:unnamed protein product [Durusdinium trenchii]|uniref:Pentatricopeptide repeat-containing protein n=1 Tax=Durusdinium trenchii TaxID=1381693 RepID=A0ABP0SZ00_9DINO